MSEEVWVTFRSNLDFIQLPLNSELCFSSLAQHIDMANNPEGGEKHPHATQHLAVQGQAPLEGRDAWTF